MRIQESAAQLIEQSEGIKVSSLAKAMHILECFTSVKPELGVTEISRQTGLNKSSVSNILSTFSQMGYIQRCSSGKFTLGLKFLEYSFIIDQHLGYSGAVYDIILEVSNSTGMVVYFGIPWYTNVLYLSVVHPVSLLAERPYKNILGEVAPLYSTGIGKAILASMPEEEWADRIPENRRAYTENTLTDYDQIIQELRKTRERGFAIDNMEKEPGLRCVAVPVMNKAGQLTAGLSASGPAGEFDEARIPQYVGTLRAAAVKMQERLYYNG